jgi:hypothetical protein
MTAQELLAKATVVHQKSDPPSTVAKSTFRTVQKVSKMITSLYAESLEAVRALVYALVKEYARPHETLRERAAVYDFLPHTLAVIAIEKASKVIYSRSHTTHEEATEEVNWCFPR